MRIGYGIQLVTMTSLPNCHDPGQGRLGLSIIITIITTASRCLLLPALSLHMPLIIIIVIGLAGLNLLYRFRTSYLLLALIHSIVVRHVPNAVTEIGRDGGDVADKDPANVLADR